MKNIQHPCTVMCTKIISKLRRVYLHRIGKILLVILLPLLSVQGQSQPEEKENSPGSRIPLSEFSLGRCVRSDHNFNYFSFYDFGISVNALRHPINATTIFGLNPYVDIHVVDNIGYNNYGFRLYTEFFSSPESSYKIALGPSWSRIFNQGYYSNNSFALGMSGEFSIFFSPHFGITSRWDRYSDPRGSVSKSVNEISVGLKIRPRGLISALGYLFGIGSLGFNSILKSQ
ncbi:MAG TPA: hypothetical protein PLV12_08185 [Saprospiraceae bacterium]|nr:hypothetical protein [Saprospiraceae bacterium]